MATAIEQIQAAAANWSIEVTPKGATKIESFRDCLNEGTTVNVTFLPGTDPADTIAVCERLHNDGMKPVPHLAARSLRNADQLDELLTAYTSRCGVEEVLCIGGGVDDPVGDFTATMEVLKTGLIQKHGIRHFCCEADIVLDWESRVRAAGNTLPIRIGIPGPATIKTLFRFAKISGIGPSMRFVAKQAKNVAKLMTVQSPHLLIAGLAEGRAADGDCLIRHFHFYPFGGFARTATYAGAIADGKMEMLPKGGFNVTKC